MATRELPELNPLNLTYDVLIVGGGMVGGMLACALACSTEAKAAGRPLKIAVLEASRPTEFLPGSQPEYSIRVSAVSVATERMFQRVGAWQGVVNRRACPFTEMAVWDGEAGGETRFDAKDIHADHLGHIVENDVLQLALFEQLEQSDTVNLYCPARLDSFHKDSDGVHVTLDDGRRLSARLLVGADGARSKVRSLAGIDVERFSYPQHALVATIETELAQQSITWQRFKPTGPEAFLPLCGHRASMVWYHDEETVARLEALDDDAFANEMETQFPTELGSIRRVVQRGSFPIAKAHAERYIDDRVALIGDAAHTVHPLAGQGVHLGLLDAAALAEVIQDAVDESRDPGSYKTLRRYERWRRGENALMINVLDGFYHAFKPQPALVQRLRSAALDVANQAKPVKHFLMRHAMGTAGDLPRLAR